MERNKKMGLYYERQLEAKIGRQKEEITRLLAENEELKKDLECYYTGTDTCDIESARAAGHQEAWKLAQKIALYKRDGGFSIDELEEIFETQYWTDVFLLTYSEATAKVAEWKKAKEEICVGDMVEFTNGIKAVVIKVYEDGEIALLFSDGGYGTYKPHRNWHKTDRHIDVNAWLAQIGGETE